MFRTACDNPVTTSKPASPPPANLTISKCPPASPICTKPHRANPSPLPHHRAPAAHRKPAPQPFRHPHTPPPAGPAVSFHPAHSRHSRICRRPHSVPSSAAWPAGTLTKHPLPADDGDQDRVIVVRPGQPAAGLASHRLNLNPPGTVNHIETEPSGHSNRAPHGAVGLTVDRDLADTPSRAWREGMIMTTTMDPVTTTNAIDQRELANHLVVQAKADGVSWWARTGCSTS